MFCEKCGNPIDESDCFCASCGAPVDVKNTTLDSQNVATCCNKKTDIKHIVAIIFTAIGMIIAVIGSILAASNHSNLTTAEKNLADLQEQISQVQNGVFGNIFGDMSSLYQNALNQCQAEVTHYKQLVVGGCVMAVVGAVVAVFCILYIFVFKKDVPIKIDATNSQFIPEIEVKQQKIEAKENSFVNSENKEISEEQDIE